MAGFSSRSSSRAGLRDHETPAAGLIDPRMLVEIEALAVAVAVAVAP
jgi:hypothetical protein